ncbi:MAG: DUF2306 domain-containing protein [Verrucomicrobia bacterium]|nr:DUF2306 domain-containing protein [Cytophagales bacterium]
MSQVSVLPKKIRFSTIISSLVVLFYTYLMLQIVLPYLSGRTDIDFLLTKQRIVHHWHYIAAFYLHIFSSIFVLAAGATQFSRTLMLDYPVWHRNIGKMYVFVVLFVSSPGALWMSFYANGGIISQIGFTVLTGLWFTFTLLAWQTVLKKDFVSHGNMMIRSYALTFSAITLRTYQFGLSFLREDNPLSPAETYIILSYLSWIPNLVIAEICIRNGFSRKLMRK